MVLEVRHYLVIIFSQEQFKSYSQGEELSSIQPNDSEDIKYLLSDDMKSYCPEDEYIISTTLILIYVYLLNFFR